MAQPILIAGPTASGKSALALALARQLDAVIVNADALQVYDGWRILTARPSAADEAQAAHALYGHVGMTQDYSVGHWLRDMAPLLKGPGRLIVTGGTGLYFSALTEGLAEIPAIPPAIRAEAESMRTDGRDPFLSALERLDPAILTRIDLANPARLQRAWEVVTATGKPLSAWQDDTPPPLLPLEQAIPFVLDSPTDWLNARIERRFGAMLAEGALEEVAAQLAQGLDFTRPSAKALGAAELAAHLGHRMSLAEAETRSTIVTRQFAKRQRTWFRSRMGGWNRLRLGPDTSAEALSASVLAHIRTLSR